MWNEKEKKMRKSKKKKQKGEENRLEKENRGEKEKMGKKEKEINFRCSDGRSSTVCELKVVHATRATRGYQNQ